MKPVLQEYLTSEGHVGDCVRAATASVLELSREDVPHFVRDNPGSDGAGWYDDWERFMVSRGVQPVIMLGPWDKPPRPSGYYLASGPSPRGKKHMVVMWDGKLAHDPHPSQDGILEIQAIWMLQKT